MPLSRPEPLRRPEPASARRRRATARAWLARVHRWSAPLTCWLAFSLALAACAEGSRNGTVRYSRDQLEADLALPVREAGVLLGDFPLKKNAVIDGDTIKVGGLDGSLRLLGIDTEETFKNDKDWRKYEVGWENYLANESAKTSRPVKIATPVGMDAKDWAKHFFHGRTRVRLERDHPHEVRGRFNRFLAYVLIERDGVWVNYNVECVRAGMSPYFTKYGYSRRFHDDFVRAEQEARDAQLGVWAPEAEHYTDYDIRLPWWFGRAAFVEAFEREAEDRPDFVVLTHWDAIRRLEGLVGQDVTLLATVGSIYRSDRGGPTRVMLARRMFQDFPLVVFDEEVLRASQLEKYAGEYVRVRGMVREYKNPRTQERSLQIVLRNPGQVETPGYFIPGVQAASGSPGPAMPRGHELPVGPFHAPGDPPIDAPIAPSVDAAKLDLRGTETQGPSEPHEVSDVHDPLAEPEARSDASATESAPSHEQAPEIQP